MKKNATLLSCLVVALLMSSCYTAKVAHGSLTTDSPVVKVTFGIYSPSTTNFYVPISDVSTKDVSTK